MSTMIGITNSIDESTLKMRESGEIYADPSVLATGVKGSGTWALSSAGVLTTLDTATGTAYKLTIANGLLQPVGV